jgi:PKD repeat protein
MRRLITAAFAAALVAGLVPATTGASSAATTATPDSSAAAASAATAQRAGPKYKVLVLTPAKLTKADRTGLQQLRQLGLDRGFTLEATSDTTIVNAADLAGFRAVGFLNTTGDLLTDGQQVAFEAYFHAGGGFLGLGSAIETESDWPFLTALLGTRATSRTAAQQGTVKVADRGHVATRDLPEYWTRTDAWYNFRDNVRGESHVLATVVERPFTTQLSGEQLHGIDGTMGADHPVAWCKDYRGGRSFYTSGSTSAIAAEADFGEHVAGAFEWTAGVADGVYSDCGATVTANFEQTKISGPPNLNEPIGFDQLPDGRVIQTARGGQLRLHDPADGTEDIIATIPVYTNSEDGLYGPAVDNDFATNQWVYLFYAPPTVTVTQSDGVVRTITTPNGSAPTTAPSLDAWDPWLGYFQLSRFKFVDGETPSLDLDSEQKILQVPNNRGACCHVAGDIDFDRDNNLWFVTGDDTPAGGGNSGGFSPFNDMKTTETQTVRVTGSTAGTFTLSLGSETTGPIAWNATAAAVGSALAGLGSVDASDITVTGGPVNAANVTVRWEGQYLSQDVAQPTADSSGLTGGNPNVAVNTTQQGDWFNSPAVDARRSSLNTNDLRGKVARIRVAADGSYTVPSGNLFAPGTAKTRPEIYAMGFRNPFRIQVDAQGVAYVTDYSPDSQTPTQFRGPAGTGRVEVVRGPSNYGWPLCYSPDLPYYRWTFLTSTPLDDPAQPHECGNPTRGPQNDSRWNLEGGPTVEAGREYSPPITKPDIWYSFRDNAGATPQGTPCFGYYGPDATSTPTCPQLTPELGDGGVGPHGAAPYDYEAANPSTTKFPPYFDGSFILGEFTRDFLREVRLDSQGNVMKISQTLPCGQAIISTAFPFECDNPMDMQFGADGSLYLLTYGDGFFAANADAGMYRFDYVKGTRAPRAVLSASRTSGQEPLTVDFSSAGSVDPDPGDSISFAWDFDGNGTTDSIDPAPRHVYTTTGQYTARLTVTDSSGKTAFASTVVTVGNTAPSVTITVPVEGGTFAFGNDIPFTVTVTDPEDGVIDCSEVEVTFVLGHDTHGHAEADTTGCTGVLPTSEDDASHGGNVFGVINASYTDHGDGAVPALTTAAQTTIRQKRQEVEHVLSQSGTNTGNSSDVGGGLQRGSLGNGDWMQLNGPFNLVNINSLTLRTSGGTAGIAVGNAEVHLDAVDGPLLTTVTVQGTGSAATYASTTVPITDPGGLHQIFLVFRPVAGGPTNNFFNLNWTEFGGTGVAVT